jgi:hypothetical protein
VPHQAHVGQHEDGQAQLLAVHQHDLTPDHAALLQLAHAPPHRRGRQPHLLGQRLRGQPRIGLQRRQDLGLARSSSFVSIELTF